MKIYICPGKLLFTIFLLIAINVNSQEQKVAAVIPKIEYQGYLGGVIKHRAIMKDMGNSLYVGNELRIGFATTGKKYWHQVNRYPIMGLGAFMGNFNNAIIGKPRAVFLFMEIPFARKPESYFSTSWSMGAVINLNEYNKILNPGNVAIGSDMNVYIDFSFSYKRKISERIELGTGIKFQHFSNAAYAMPNLGLNMLNAAISMAYYPAKTNNTFINDASHDIYRKYEITTMASGAWRDKNVADEDSRFFNSTVSLSLSKRMNARRTFGVGFDYFYQPYLIDYYEDKTNVSDKDLMSYATYLSSELVISRIRLIAQLGFYLHRPVDFGKVFYERVGVRYYITNFLFGNVTLKAHGAKAEFLEWGLGFTF